MGAIATGVVEGTISAASYAATETLAYGRDVSFGDVLSVGLNNGIMAGCMKDIMQSIGLCNCFIAGTLVAAETGYVTIENIKAGDLVWAHDPETGETALKPVVQTFRNETTEWIHVTVNGETLTCTPEHPFYVPKKGWTSAIDLRAGDILVMLNGEYVVVEQVQHELLESPETTYNFEVENFHTYFVGDSKILVHNKCKGVGGKGWEGDATWRNNVKTVGEGGTITELKGGIPTQAQAEKLILQSGGTPLRAEMPHQSPNPHTFHHINYLTSRGIKGTLRVLARGFKNILD